MKKSLLMIFTALICVVACVFGLVACDNDNSEDSGSTQTVAVESVTLNKTTLSLDIGEEETLTATIAPDNASNKAVTWSVAPAGVVTVENGVVTAVAVGTATVTATAGEKSATCAVTVNQPEATTIEGTYYMIMQGANGWYPEMSMAFRFYADGTGDFDGKGSYTIEDGVITIKYDAGPEIFYGKIEGKILWMFLTKEDAADNSKSIQPFYSDKEISQEDLAKITAVFGDGVTSGSKVISEEEWKAAFSEEVTACKLTASSATNTKSVYKFDFVKNIYYVEMPASSPDGIKVSYTIIAEDGGKFYYYFSADGTTWQRESITEDEFKSYAAQFASSMQISEFKDKYSAFTYSDGTFTADSIVLQGVLTLSNVVVKFEGVELKSVDFVAKTPDGDVAETIEFGPVEIAIPTDFTENVSPSVAGSYYMVVKGEKGWETNTAIAVVFNEDGTCDVNGSGKYTVEDGVMTVTADNGGMVAYGVFDGKILYIFANKEDAVSGNNAMQAFYGASEISEEDGKKLTAVFGESIGQGESSYTVTEKEWNDAINFMYKNMTYKIELYVNGQVQDSMVVKLTEDGSIHQYAGISWSEKLYIVNPDGTVSAFVCKNNVWEEVTGYDNMADYVAGNYGDDIGMMKLLPSIAAYNANCVFNESDNTYSMEVDMGGTKVTVKLRFENKHLVYIDLGSVGDNLLRLRRYRSFRA